MCSFKKTCPIRKNLKKIQNDIESYFNGVILKDLFGEYDK